MGEYRFMRLFVFFDLPVTTPKDKREYQRFRKFLINDGYDMLQFSVYSNIVNGEDAVEKHLARLKSNLPPKGSVRFLQVTEKQYARMKILVGPETVKEKSLGVQRLLVF